jgi:hypothetical protein
MLFKLLRGGGGSKRVSAAKPFFILVITTVLLLTGRQAIHIKKGMHRSPSANELHSNNGIAGRCIITLKTRIK